MSLDPQSHRNERVSDSLPGVRRMDEPWRVGESLLDATHEGTQRTGLLRRRRQRVAHLTEAGMCRDHALFNSRGSRPSSIAHILATRL